MTKYDLGIKLNGRNYNQWFLLLSSHLRSERLSDYITIDVVNNARSDLRDAANEAARLAQLPQDQRDDEALARQRNIVQGIRQAVEEAEAKEATVNSIIISNVTEKVLTYIQNINNPREKIEKLEFLYHRDEEEKYSLLLARIYNLKAKNVQNVMDVLNEIVEIFNVLDDTNLRINNLEKLIIMQEALPRDLAKEFKPRANIDPTAFYNEIKDTVTFYNYKSKRNINKPKK
jgi:hypothetical protein